MPQPIAGPSQAGAKARTAQDRDRPCCCRDQLSYPETKLVGRSAHSDQHAGPARQRRGPDQPRSSTCVLSKARRVDRCAQSAACSTEQPTGSSALRTVVPPATNARNKPMSEGPATRRRGRQRSLRISAIESARSHSRWAYCTAVLYRRSRKLTLGGHCPQQRTSNRTRDGTHGVTIRPRCGGIPSRTVALRKSDHTRLSEDL